MSNKDTRDKIRMVRTNEQEDFMIIRLMKKNGCNSFAELIRLLLKQEYKK